MSDNQQIGNRIEQILTDKRVRSRRAFALSIGADPSFFDKIIKGNASLTDGYADKIVEKYGVNKEWLFSGQGEKYISARHSEPTPMEILDRLSLAFIDQAAAFRAQAEIMKSIESKMAQESTQAKLMEQNNWMILSLQDMQGKVTTVWERQHMAIEEIREQFEKLGVEKIPASGGAHKRRGQNGGTR